MAPEPRSEQPNVRYEKWVALWAAGVRASALPMAVGDPATGKFIELSPSAVRLIGEPENYLDVVQPRDASSEMLRLMRGGLLEGASTRRRLRHVDGSLIDVQAFGWIVRSQGGSDLCLGMWIPDGVAFAADGGIQEVLTPAFPKQDHARARGDRMLIDEEWRVRDISTDAGQVLGWPPQELVGSSLIEQSHPDDVPSLLFALARATSESSTRTVVRFRHRTGTWPALEIEVEIVNDDVGALAALVLTSEAAPITAIPSELRRIADHIETAGVVAPLADITDALGLVEAGDLSPRQWEVVRRLVRGERVSTIAAEMHLSRSTIRNHLSAIFAKVGVHSQEELVARYHRRRPEG